MSAATTTQTTEVVDIDCTIIPYGQRSHEHRQEEEEEEDEDGHRRLISCEPDHGGGHHNHPNDETLIVELCPLESLQTVTHSSQTILSEYIDHDANSQILVENKHFQDVVCDVKRGDQGEIYNHEDQVRDQIEVSAASQNDHESGDVDDQDDDNDDEADEDNDDEEEADDEEDDGSEEDEDDDDDDDDDDDEDDEDEEEDDEDCASSEEEEGAGMARLDKMDDIVDPGQNCLLISHVAESDGFMIESIHQQQQHHHHLLNHHQMQHNEQQLPPQANNTNNNNLPPKLIEDNQDSLDGERMLEVTRKLVRNTERDPDRDLRKQVLLKTAIKKLPHFMDYHNRYSDNLDQSFQNNNMSPQAYYEHHHLPNHHHPSHHIHNSPHLIHQNHNHDEIQHKSFYQSVQPNAIQMSTTSLRMLDLNDDRDIELSAIDQQDHQDPNLSYNNHSCNSNTDSASLEQHDYISQQQYERYHHNIHNQNSHLHQENQHSDQSNNELNHHYDNGGPMLSRHNSLDNLYQPITGTEINDDMKDERIPIAFQIACEIYDFTCTPDDNEKKLLDNLTNGYYTTRPTKDPISSNNHDVDDIGDDDDGDDDEVIGNGTDTRDQDVSDTSSSSHSSSSDESANSSGSQSTESDGFNDSALLEASLNSSSNFYHASHDSGVALFSPRSNKRSSSSIGLDDEMDIDQLTELTTRTSSIGSNNQYKKLRKREMIE